MYNLNQPTQILNMILINNTPFLAHKCIFCTLATENVDFICFENIDNIKLFQFIHKRNVILSS